MAVQKQHVTCWLVAGRRGGNACSLGRLLLPGHIPALCVPQAGRKRECAWPRASRGPQRHCWSCSFAHAMTRYQVYPVLQVEGGASSRIQGGSQQIAQHGAGGEERLFSPIQTTIGTELHIQHLTASPDLARSGPPINSHVLGQEGRQEAGGGTCRGQVGAGCCLHCAAEAPCGPANTTLKTWSLLPAQAAAAAAAGGGEHQWGAACSGPQALLQQARQGGRGAAGAGGLHFRVWGVSLGEGRWQGSKQGASWRAAHGLN